MQKILLVEDDPEITALLDLHLNSDIFKLTSCNNGNGGLELVAKNDYDLVILDLMLPDMSGMEVCKKIRSRGNITPLIMLTCHSEESDKVLGLEMGADDYITKPFGILELIARAKALMRRAGKSIDLSSKGEIAFKDIRVDQDKRKVSFKGKRLDLTPKEFDLLLLLINHPGKTFSRQELLERIWGYAFSGYEHTVTAHINRLRIKMETDLNHPEYILTSWGTGYRFREETI